MFVLVPALVNPLRLRLRLHLFHLLHCDIGLCKWFTYCEGTAMWKCVFLSCSAVVYQCDWQGPGRVWGVTNYRIGQELSTWISK